jgi:hypothetical protein
MPAKKPAAKNKTRTKTAKPTPKSGSALIPQPNGRGALLSGGKLGNKGGIGRPPSELRARLVGTFAQRVGVIESIADGAPVKVVEVPLLTLLQYATCPRCGDALTPTVSVADAVMTQIRVTESASPGDRLKALDLAGKYGLGVKEEITVTSPDVVTRLQRQVSVILSRETWSAADLLTALDEVWT